VPTHWGDSRKFAEGDGGEGGNGERAGDLSSAN
jgi:hypothetical protein